jgi:hypothetical protein
LRVKQIVCLAALALVALCGCGDSSTEIERKEGLQLRRVLRQCSNELGKIHAVEHQFAVNVRRFLATIGVNSPGEPKWPTVESVTDLIKRVTSIEADRTKIQYQLNAEILKSPLPIAIREDVVDELEEQLAVNRQWRVHLNSLRQALENQQEVIAREATEQLIELFRAYGPLRNHLRLAADDIEEQLRLPWDEDNELVYKKQRKSSEQK